MNVSVLLAWIMVALLAAVSALLLMGKGFLIAGYNIASKETKRKVNTKKLCRIVGSGFCVITVIIAIFTFYEFELPSAIAWLLPWGLLGTIAVMLVLANTICKAKTE